jgi:hypothetical protein
MLCSEQREFFENIVKVLELIEPIINTPESLAPNYSNTINLSVKRVPKLGKKGARKGKGL